MANILEKHPKNLEGNFFVDKSCIDCDSCRWIAPKIFADIGDQSVVYHQPENQEEKIKALQALIACPTASIGLIEKDPDIVSVQNSFSGFYIVSIKTKKRRALQWLSADFECGIPHLSIRAYSKSLRTPTYSRSK